MKKISALIIDDEKPARDRIRFMLENHPKIAVIGECKNGFEAVSQVESTRPDLIFLDIQMPELDGFDVIEAIGTDAVPRIIFVTAYDQYAIKAFEVNALDYLLKPFDEERFTKAIARAVDEIQNTESNKQSVHLKKLLSNHTGTGYLKRMLIKTSSKVDIIKTEQIECIVSAGNYVEIHAEKKKYLYRSSMKELLQRLDPSEFARIHRSAIVKLDAIQSFEPLLNNDYQLRLHSGKTLTLSRRYYSNLKSILENL